MRRGRGRADAARGRAGSSGRSASPTDAGAQTALNAIRMMDAAGIGHSKKWYRIARKVSSGAPLTPGETEYYTRLTRIYTNPAAASRTGRSYHTKLSEQDAGQACAECGGSPEYYCHVNDVYLCGVHVVGHDPNE